MKKILIIICLIICIDMVLRMIPHENLSLNSQNVSEITISGSVGNITIVNTMAVKYLIKMINNISLYDSDLDVLQSSPDNSIRIKTDDNNEVRIYSSGIYALILETQIDNGRPSIISGELYRMRWFTIDYIWVVAKLMNIFVGSA